MRKNAVVEFKLLPVVAAILLVYGSAYAEEDSEVQELITPESSVTLGVGGVNSARDAKRFSQYTGLNKSGSVLLDADYNRRNDDTGLWTKFSARNMGQETRELKFSQSKQGNWKYALDYNEIVRLDPYTINTGMTGIGSTTPTANLIATPAMPAAWAAANGIVASNGVAGTDVELKLKRTALGISGEKWVTPELQFELSFRTEDKKGARMFGRAGLDSFAMRLRPADIGGASPNGGWAVLLTPEPISSTSRLIEGKMNFMRDNLAVTAGYFGSFYVNNNGSLSPNVPGALNRGALWTGCATAGCSTVKGLADAPVALPPDNQSHQFYLSGNYAHSDTTRSNFKLAYTRATQNENFVAMGLGLGPYGQASLGGMVDTTLAQFGLTMRPLKALSVNASFRYEDRADKTPVSLYNTNLIPGNFLNGTTNWGSGSQTRTNAKLDGIYRFASGYSVTLGGDWERKDTPLPPANAGVSPNQLVFRPLLNEFGVHGEVRKAMSEKLNGALGMEFKQRRGSDTAWVTTALVRPNPLVTFNPAGALGNRILPDIYMDRDRTKLRGNLDWEASEKLSMQAVVEHTQDDYKRAFSGALLAAQLVPTVPGAKTIISDSFSLDGTYMVSDDWRVNGFFTRSYSRWNVNKTDLGNDTRNTDDTFGVGVNGKLTSRLSFGVDVLTTRDVTTYTNMPSAGNIAGFGVTPGNYLPNINYTTNKLNLHAKYDVDKASAVQALLSYQQFTTNDWQWGYNGVPFVYSDNTTVSQPMSQKLIYAGASYQLKF